MSETQSIRYWFALIFSTIISIIFALAIIVLSWYLLWKFVLSRFGVLRALFQLNQNDKPAAPAAPAAAPTPSRRQHIRRE